MAEIIHVENDYGIDLSSYPCETQQEEDPSWGYAPRSHLDGTTGDNAPDQPDSLVVGVGPIVPRWDVSIPGGRTLRYFVRPDTFPNTERYKIASVNFRDAAQTWNDLKLGITISETYDRSAANFCVVYEVNPESGDGSKTFARAFFPHELDQDVIVFSKAFGATDILKNIFQHEIGHILGLRHEFAVTGDARKGLRAEGQGAVQYLEMNYNSIMSYNVPPKMQPSDREQVLKFYQLPNGYMMGSSPVTDFAPPDPRRSK